MTQDDLEAFARRFFTAVDAQNADGLRPFLADNVRLQMANLQPTVGADDLVKAFRATEEQFSSITHAIQGCWLGRWEKGLVVSVEAIAHYTKVGGAKFALPVTSTLRLSADGKVADYRIFMDPGPAFA
ncbi:nuclear transport factor 2 family protein [Acaryochloris marina]|uniref:SnoaL-like domain-containing protein n=1 Tax=Acaryochloris marina (strain MBIC 11017) TaxID=329726 RepID=B0C5C2_ACAM1|nr:nuclear transport factor 2 family protein [Acaryochloris marina]ABW26362.1 hypothetical protein AM1_1328 [Acaryochloris marina MBIC11017]BDM81181.1 hypothetical protein AM10699_40480 [Acaryochloris marina MBIC10699]